MVIHDRHRGPFLLCRSVICRSAFAYTAPPLFPSVTRSQSIGRRFVQQGVVGADAMTPRPGCGESVPSRVTNSLPTGAFFARQSLRLSFLPRKRGELMSISTRALAEFFGTFWLVFGGCGSALFAAAYPQLGIGFAGV